MLIGFCVLVFLVAASFARPRNGAGAIVERALRRFPSMSELDFAPLEREMQKRFPAAPERDLLYALRVSKTVPNVTKLKTLASRWNTANFGAGGSGLSMGKRAARHSQVAQFLASLYLQRLDVLLAAEAEKALAVIAARKSPTAKANAAAKSDAALAELRYEFLHDLPGAVNSIERCRARLQAPPPLPSE